MPPSPEPTDIAVLVDLLEISKRHRRELDAADAAWTPIREAHSRATQAAHLEAAEQLLAGGDVGHILDVFGVDRTLYSQTTTFARQLGDAIERELERRFR